MGILFKARVAVRGQHLAVRIDGDALALRLLDTDLREVLLYIKYSKEKEKLVDLIQTDDGFQNMKTETVVMLNTLTNSQLKFNEEKEETSMCLAIDELREEAKQEGIEFGRRELIEKMLMNHETMDKIKEYTGYTQEKIDEIAKELSAR